MYEIQCRLSRPTAVAVVMDTLIVHTDATLCLIFCEVSGRVTAWWKKRRRRPFFLHSALTPLLPERVNHGERQPHDLQLRIVKGEQTMRIQPEQANGAMRGYAIHSVLRCMLPCSRGFLDYRKR